MFEIRFKLKKPIDVKKAIIDIVKLKWSVYSDKELMKYDDMQDFARYILNLGNHPNLKCFITELFPEDEEEWNEDEYPNREEIVKSALEELKNCLLIWK